MIEHWRAGSALVIGVVAGLLSGVSSAVALVVSDRDGGQRPVLTRQRSLRRRVAELAPADGA